jgi:predicted HAD superfamily phosphohydrolase YqeG
MNDSLASTLVLCDLDNLLLGEDGNLTQVVRDVLQLFSSRGGRLTVFSQRSPRARGECGWFRAFSSDRPP